MIGTIADFRAYQTARGHAGPAAASDGDATIALVRGSDYVRNAFDLTVEETDSRVIDAAYVAAGFELSAAGALVAHPGFWVKNETGKAVTQVGDISFSFTSGRKTSDAISPHQMVANALRGAHNAAGTLLRA